MDSVKERHTRSALSLVLSTANHPFESTRDFISVQELHFELSQSAAINSNVAGKLKSLMH